MARWLRILRGYSHAVQVRHGDEVEFACGKQRNDADLVLPSRGAKRCLQCEAYLRNAKRHPAA